MSRQENDTNASGRRMGALYQEHLMLDANFGRGLNGVAVPQSYGDGRGELEAFDEGAALCDLSGMYVRLMSGACAPSFARTAFAGTDLRVGSCSFEAVLTGDGAVTSVPLLARTGDSEYAVCDLSQRCEALEAWLGFLAQVSQRGVTPFEGIVREDVDDRMTPLLLWGRAAERTLTDYVPNSSGLPAPGCVCACALDGRIHVLAMAPDLGARPAYLMLVPSNQARVLWRSLLSFEEVHPVGTEALHQRLLRDLPWAGLLRGSDRISLDDQQLQNYGLVRQTNDFVGARGLRP
ncbi:MAG: hypothetical protein PUD09_01575 [Coriobacteriales bacterium]|nr:hypothetical protein [Coriobacteriales bacterium]